jgi:hypothetical protein
MALDELPKECRIILTLEVYENLLEAYNDYWPLKRSLVKLYSTFASQNLIEANLKMMLNVMKKETIAKKCTDPWQPNSTDKYKL